MSPRCVIKPLIIILNAYLYIFCLAFDNDKRSLLIVFVFLTFPDNNISTCLSLPALRIIYLFSCAICSNEYP